MHSVSVKLCGIELFSEGSEAFLAELRARNDRGERTFIATPNPEILLHALGDEAFAETLRSMDARVPDGFGIVLVQWLLRRPLPKRVSGSDLLVPLARDAAERGWKVVLVGDDRRESNRLAAERLAQDIPGIKLLRFDHDVIVREGNGWAMPDRIAEALAMSGPTVVFAGLGMKKQEEWLMQQVAGFPDVKIGIGCGGAFAMLAGTLRRAPRFMRVLGVEWLWRLMLEPSRLPRILRAVFIFPIRVLMYELTKNR